MPGATTEVLNDDLKVLKDDLHKVHLETKDEFAHVRSEISGEIQRVDATLGELKVLIKVEANGLRTDLTKEINRVDVSLAELKTQVTFSTKVAIWGITLLTGSVLSGLFGGAWWASRIDYKVDQLESRFDKIVSRFEKLESKVEKVESRLDNLDSKLDKLLEQTKPK